MIAIILGFIFYGKNDNKVNVGFVLPENTSLTIYEPFTAEGLVEENKILRTITSSGNYDFSKGFTYSYIAENTNTFEPVKGSFVAQNGTTVNITFDYSKEYLINKLKEESAAINSAITQKYPEQMGYYTLNYGKLYKDGKWFAGKLVPNINKDRLDVFQVVMHKENDGWKVITTPDISLSKDVYPDVPRDVLEELNIVTRDESMDREAKAQ